MRLYDFNDYKLYLNKWIENQPKSGRGLLSRIAKELGIHTTLLSHTIRGSKDLSIEQAFAICEFIGLSEEETNYFILLVQIERAGNIRLKNKFKNDLKKLKLRTQNIVNRVATDSVLTETQRAQFYSSWLYSALRQLSSIDEYQTRANLISAYPIMRDEIEKILQFLIATGLCKEGEGKIKIGPSKTHIEAKSPLVYIHHKNWRIKGFEKHNNLMDDELMYTAPFTISYEDFIKFREKVVQLIEQLVRTTDMTKPERLACFNVDLFFVK